MVNEVDGMTSVAQQRGYDGRMGAVRRHYGVPVYRGAAVRFDGTPMHVISSTGSHLWLRDDRTGRRVGPCHPTWKMDYGDDRDHGADCDRIIEVHNDWLNGRITSAECRAKVVAIRA